VLEQLAQKYSANLDIYGVNVDQARPLAMSLGIRAIPTLIFYKDGAEVNRLTGPSPEEVEDALKALAPPPAPAAAPAPASAPEAPGKVSRKKPLRKAKAKKPVKAKKKRAKKKR
jgi:thioredoxin-like negative regulator of GroEL